uniref:Uncharacterized protein n=1 Tax=Chenopodium quinoa TaxID=63459 RepID=A0A803M1E2_CHEQI
MVRPPPCCDKLNARKGAWGEDKDGTTFAYVSKQGMTNWSSVPRKTGEMAKSPECFSWHDFLLEEAFKPAQSRVQEQDENNLAEYLLINDNRGVDCKEIQAGSSPLIASSDASSFLEVMLDQENDMFLSFPGLMEEPSY